MPAAPVWFSFLPRFPLGVCACARSVGTRWYARAACPDCHGAGVVLKHPIPAEHPFLAKGA